jgi:hypothetical protein
LEKNGQDSLDSEDQLNEDASVPDRANDKRFILSNSSNPVIPSNNLKTPSHKGLMSSVAKNRIGDRIGERQCVVALAQH